MSILFLRKNIDTREFSAWSMRFINLDFYDRDKIKGYQKDKGNLMDWNAINASLAKHSYAIQKYLIAKT